MGKRLPRQHDAVGSAGYSDADHLTDLLASPERPKLTESSLQTQSSASPQPTEVVRMVRGRSTRTKTYRALSDNNALDNSIPEPTKRKRLAPSDDTKVIGIIEAAQQPTRKKTLRAEQRPLSETSERAQRPITRKRPVMMGDVLADETNEQAPALRLRHKPMRATRESTAASTEASDNEVELSGVATRQAPAKRVKTRGEPDALLVSESVSKLLSSDPAKFDKEIESIRGNTSDAREVVRGMAPVKHQPGELMWVRGRVVARRLEDGEWEDL